MTCHKRVSWVYKKNLIPFCLIIMNASQEISKVWTKIQRSSLFVEMCCFIVNSGFQKCLKDDYFWYLFIFQDEKASYDVNGHDPDPTPRYDYTNENRSVFFIFVWPEKATYRDYLCLRHRWRCRWWSRRRPDFLVWSITLSL